MKSFKIYSAPIVIALAAIVTLSCSDENPTPIPETGLLKITTAYAAGAATKVEIHARESFFPGYNSLFISLFDSVTDKRITDSQVTIHPVMTMGAMTHSCPVENPPASPTNGLFPASVVFTMPSSETGSWHLEVDIHNPAKGLAGKAVMQVEVSPTVPPRVLSFEGANSQRYNLSYVFRGSPKVGVNEFEVIAFALQSGQYLPAEDLTLKLTPEMPAMDHGSPNNADPVHLSGGHYSGKVNFTMTGEWRLHLEISQGGTPVANKYFDVIIP